MRKFNKTIFLIILYFITFSCSDRNNENNQHDCENLNLENIKLKKINEEERLLLLLFLGVDENLRMMVTSNIKDKRTDSPILRYCIFVAKDAVEKKHFLLHSSDFRLALVEKLNKFIIS